MSAAVTQWYPYTIKPLYEGWYDTRIYIFGPEQIPKRKYWTGVEFIYHPDLNAKPLQMLEWRGLSSQPDS